ncbi:MAG: acetyl-CoA carboxylase carboxyltransferase subunit alpha [Alphaproteobacteria bacterium]|nr:acetyl-CoA carboxylase carboxyltransferase subunit alpha [Alphaproteobacteria bacterium]
MSALEFEKPVLELESKLTELMKMPATDDMDIHKEITRIQQKIQRLLHEAYSKLTPAQKVQVARHAERPRFHEYIAGTFTDFTPLAGDRLYAEDKALVGGLAKLDGRPVVVMGQEKGWDTDSRIKHNFGMARPEGYRKAQRLMEMANQFQLPVISLVDTSGAYPGVDAEERGQSEAIAKSIESCLDLSVPMISVIIGEGGSGGAIAIATANRILMLEHAIYSVISPEGCASILWRSATHAQEAAAALKLTAQDLYELGLIDEIISEPIGGAHRHKEEMIEQVKLSLIRNLSSLTPWNTETIRLDRRKKFIQMGRLAA